jgi:hypothetical protein
VGLQKNYFQPSIQKENPKEMPNKKIMCQKCGVVTARYASINDKDPIRCFGCKLDTDISRSYGKSCQKCDMDAVYGIPDTREKLFCLTHRDPLLHVDLVTSKCHFVEKGVRCPDYARYCPPGSHSGIFCKEHAPSHFVSKNYSSCVICNYFAAYIDPKTDQRYCKIHTKSGFIKMCYGLCIEPKCPIHASFAVLGQRPVHCAQHRDKAKDEINIIRRECHGKNEDGSDCTGSAYYAPAAFRGPRGGFKPLYCSSHKNIDDISRKEYRKLNSKNTAPLSKKGKKSISSKHGRENDQIDTELFMKLVKKARKTREITTENTSKYAKFIYVDNKFVYEKLDSTVEDFVKSYFQ